MIGLFVPCYVDQLYPDVAQATLEVLQAHGREVIVPPDQTCCGQPFVNFGTERDARPLAEYFRQQFSECDYIVCPSGSCAATLGHYAQHFERGRASAWDRVYELTEYLVDVLQVPAPAHSFPHRVLVHHSCHGLRHLGLAQSSELMTDPALRSVDRAEHLLRSLRDVTLVAPERRDECCGFGGSFAIAEQDVSTRMGCDRIEDFERAGAEVITSSDMSCLMHLSGLMRRQNKSLHVMHIAQILANRPVQAVT